VLYVADGPEALVSRPLSTNRGGHPITLTTLLRICESLDVRLGAILAGMDR